jgi:hypothetical protein
MSGSPGIVVLEIHSQPAPQLRLVSAYSSVMAIRLDFSIPLVSVDSPQNTWQENGLYFSIIGKPFQES